MILRFVPIFSIFGDMLDVKAALLSGVADAFTAVGIMKLLFWFGGARGEGREWRFKLSLNAEQ